jgi:hypothetical protein
MKDFEELRVIADAITYKETWQLHIKYDGRMFFQWSWIAPCANTGARELQHSRKWYLSKHMTDGEIVQTAFAAALQAEEHECREFFKYAGVRVMNPHLSLHALVSRAHMTEGRE